MTDLSKLSDAELQALYAKPAAKPPGDMSDDELKAAYAPRGSMDKLLGLTGERVQTWPERAVREIWSIPERNIKAASSAPPGSREATEAMIGPAADAALVMGPLRPTAGAAAGVRGTPTVQELKSASSAGYDAARGMGVDIKPGAITSMGGNIAVTLEKDGINAELAPKTFSILQKLQSAPDGSVVTIGNLDTVRRTLGNAAKDFANPTEQLAAKRAQQFLDDYLARIPEGDVLAGNAVQASKTLSDARGNYAAAKRSEQIGEATEAAELGAAAANSGRNIGNQNRQKFKSILTSDKQSAGYSAEELAQLEKIVRGTSTGNALRTTGNFLGGGGGLGQAVVTALAGGGGAAVGGVPGAVVGAAAVPVLGNMARALANKSVDRQVNILDDLVRSRSPLAQALMEDAPPVVVEMLKKKNPAMVRALMAESQSQ